MNSERRGVLLILGAGLWAAALCPSAAAAKSAAKTAAAPKRATPLVVSGQVKAATRSPRPGSVPYKDAVIALHLAGVKPLRGKLRPKEIVVLTWGMRANRLTTAAAYRKGQTVRLLLTPWERVERKYGSYNRVELEDAATFRLDTYWGEPSQG